MSFENIIVFIREFDFVFILFAKVFKISKWKSNLRENTRQQEIALSFINYSENYNRQTSRN